MDVVTYSYLRQNLARVMDEVTDSHSLTVVSRRGRDDAVVMMSLADYNGMMETLHLLQSPKNAERLARALADVESGRFLHRDLVDEPVAE